MVAPEKTQRTIYKGGKTMHERFTLAVAIFVGVAASRVEATTRWVMNDGTDGAGCGAKAAPCRSITQAMSLAVDGDTIMVGPGNYGDLNGSGVFGDFPGEEPGSSG